MTVPQRPAATGAAPLARLFAIAYRDLVVELHAHLRDRGWTDLRPAYGFALLSVREGPRSSVELAAALGMTKQAATKLVDALVDGGFIRRTQSETDGRVRRLKITQRGRSLLTDAEEIYVELEGRWEERIGSDRVAALRNDLVEMLSDDEGVLPPVRPIW